MRNKGDTWQKSGKRAICETGEALGNCVCPLIDLSLLLKGEHSKLLLSPFFLGCSYLLCCCLLFSRLVVPDSLWPHGLQHTRLPCPLLSPGVCSNSCPLSQWCHPTISSSVAPFSSCPQSFPESGSFPMSWLFESGSQIIGDSASASVLPMNIQDWFALGLTGLISLQSKRLSRVFSNTTVQKHQFFSTQLSL